MWKTRHSAGAGFSLVELLVVMAVLGILAWAAAPLAEVGVQRGREQELKRALWEIRSAIDAYKRAADLGWIATGPNGYPVSLEDLVRGVPDRRVAGQYQYFLRRIPVDPFVRTGQGWGLRSFESPPDNPQPGVDVYDVYSLSDKRALDGTLLRDW